MRLGEDDAVELTEERFRALARSSPWRWSTLRFTIHEHPPGNHHRAWLQRPDRLRVEDLDTGIGVAAHDEAGRAAAVPEFGAWLDAPSPVLDADGLVRVRPDVGFDTDPPLNGNYVWASLLDPVELAGGADGSGTRLGGLVEVEHHGRLAWEALAQPADGYDPLCSCCSLLICEDSFLGQKPPGFVMPDATRVRLDVETGVCVLAEQVGGSRAGHGHDVAIEAVDEPMPDELFGSNHRRRRFHRGWRRWLWQ